MKSFKSILEFNPAFFSSVNIDYDLNDEAKISEYIPTADNCRIIRSYLESVLSDVSSIGNSTLLFGPYGKGKSFLVLILLYLLSGNSKSDVYCKLVEKIKKTDSELSEIIMNLNERKIHLLPICINGDYTDIKQAFLLAINDALKRFGLKELIPESSYDVALRLISNWEGDEYLSNSYIPDICKEAKLDFSRLKNGLAKHDKNSYHDFCRLYEIVTKGMPFNPLIDESVDRILYQIASAVRTFGFNGLFVIFDEFSKFLESGVENIGSGLKILQDVFEVANESSADCQIHVCCIAHKRFSAYGKSYSSSLKDSFSTIEGRITEISFTKSEIENYQMIAYAIGKKKGFNEFFNVYEKEHSAFYSWFIHAGLIDESQREIVFRDCFPLNPLTAVTSILLSELVAQNERTLFSFISGNDSNSVKNLVYGGLKELVGVDRLFDFFSSSLSKSDDSRIKDIWVKAEGIISNSSDSNEILVVKALAISLIIDAPMVFPPTAEAVAHSVGLDPSCCLTALKALIDQRKLIKSQLTGYLGFSIQFNQQIYDAIDKYIAVNKNSIRIADILNEINPDSFYVPKKYNTDHHMVRFFRSRFIEAEVFIQLSSYDDLLNEAFCDGLILNIVPANKISSNQLLESYITASGEKDRVVLRIPRKELGNEASDSLRKLFASAAVGNGLKNDSAYSSLKLLHDDLEDELKVIVHNWLNEADYISSVQNESSISKIVQISLENVYPETIIINNEIINKDKQNAPAKKACIAIADCILQDEKPSGKFSETSLEMTTYLSVFRDSEKVSRIEDSLVPIITGNGKHSFSELVSFCTSRPFGVRRGIIPLLIAKAIRNFSGYFSLYFKGTEICLDGSAIYSAVYNSDDYEFIADPNSEEKQWYRESLVEISGASPSYSFEMDLYNSLDCLRSFIKGLPSSVINSVPSGNIADLSNEAISLKQIFLRLSASPRAVFFSQIPSLYGINLDSLEAYKRVIDSLKGTIAELHDADGRLGHKLAAAIKSEFNADSDSSIRSSVAFWFAENGIKEDGPEVRGLTGEVAKVGSLVLSTHAYDDNQLVILLSKLITRTAYSDWISDKSAQLIAAIDEFKKAVKPLIKRMPEQKVQISPIGQMMKSSLEASIDEFGESIPAEEKIQVLLKLVEEIRNDLPR